MSAERTLVLIKPDGVQRALIGEIIGRFERTGLKLVGMKLIRVTESMAAQHYAEHAQRPFYPGLIKFITSGPVVAMCIEGPGAVASVRRLMGATNPQDSAPGTIRGDFGVEIGRNLVHGSATLEDAEREVTIFFDPKELVEFARSTEPWIVEG